MQKLVLISLSRRDIPKVAQRFNAGLESSVEQVPKGRLKVQPTGAAVRCVRFAPRANTGRLLGLLLAWLCGSIAANASVQESLQNANQLEVQGQFKEAAALLTAALTNRNAQAIERQQLDFELDRLERIRKDFPLTRQQLFSNLQKSVHGLSEQEYDNWIAEGRFDSREIDGHRFFMSASVKNLFSRYPDLNPRRIPQKDTSALQKARLECADSIREAARAAKTPYVLPKRFHVTMTVTAQPSAAPPGEVIRAWLPVPRSTPFQGSLELISSLPSTRHIAEEQSSIRSVYLEQAAKKSKPTLFDLEYNYTVHGVCFDLSPADVKPCDPKDPTLAPFIGEAPHVVFMPEMRALSQQIVGNETNPCIKAKKCYDWIAEHIQYSLAIEYSTIRNISDYCRSKGYGDCGQEAFLFIALCRLNGVPARWQSGWNTFPDDEDIHDWSEIYLAPYGWVPVDPYMGIFAMEYAPALAREQKIELRDFYFGGLDQFRMIANSDHNQDLNPPKQSMRSDNVDFQRGELEWGRHNIYFDQYSYHFTVKEIKLLPGT